MSGKFDMKDYVEVKDRISGHGRVAEYRKGCRCSECREANAEAMREWRQSKGPRVQRTPLQRFFGMVEKTPTCWLWKGSLDGSRYGMFKAETKRTVRAHRWGYEALVGPIPEGLQLDHLCRVRHCVNPAHLEPVTNAENQRRAQKTHCIRGHEFTEENTYWAKSCKACWRVRKDEAS